MRWVAIAWVVVMIEVAAWMGARGNDVDKEAQEMTWSETKDVVIKARPEGIWTWAFDYVKGPVMIKIQASGAWSYSAAKQCGPDGDLNVLMSSAKALLPGAPIGALILKVGGSTAGTTDGTVKVAGSGALVEIPDTVSGPIFLTINDELTGLADNHGELKVTISIAPLPGGSAKPSPQPSEES